MPRSEVVWCQRCHVRPATERWADGGALDVAHGFVQHWCKRCVLVVQLAHAEKMAGLVEGLRAELVLFDLTDRGENEDGRSGTEP